MVFSENSIRCLKGWRIFTYGNGGWKPIVVGEVTLIPIIEITFGLGSGEYQQGQQRNRWLRRGLAPEPRLHLMP